MQRHLFRLVVRRGCIAMIKGKWQVSADRMTTTAFPLDGKRACPLVYCGHVWREREGNKKWLSISPIVRQDGDSLLANYEELGTNEMNKSTSVMAIPCS